MGINNRICLFSVAKPITIMTNIMHHYTTGHPLEKSIWFQPNSF